VQGLYWQAILDSRIKHSGLLNQDVDGLGLGLRYARRILEDAGQASNIIADVRLQAGMTKAEAIRGAFRAFDADKVFGRLRSIRLIGQDFDVTLTPAPSSPDARVEGSGDLDVRTQEYL
jgi:phage head maturation protease